MTFESDLLFSMVKTLFTVGTTLLLLFALTDFKYSTRRLLSLYGIYLFYLCGVSYFCITRLGWVDFMRSCIITIYIPAFALTYFVATDHALQAIFHYATQFDIGLILSVTGTLLNTALRGNKVSDLVIRAVLFAAVFFLEYRFLRKPFRQIADTLVTNRNWGILAAVPVCFGILFLACGLFPVHFVKSSWAVIHVYLAALVMAVTYVVVFRSLMDSCKHLETVHQNELLTAQTAALEKHTETLIQQAEQEAIFQNDVRCYTRTLYLLIQGGKTDEALNYLGDLDMDTASVKPEEYCNDTILNDILGYYLDRAKAQGITVDTALRFPSPLPIDAIELATVFANAIENAMEAMETLPEEDRKLWLISTDKPQFALEIANTCPDHIVFDSDGVPLDDNHQRNIRTRSILAFVNRHNAYFDYDKKDHTFRLRLVFNVGDGSDT